MSGPRPVVDFSRTARRLRRVAVGVFVVVPITWPIVGRVRGEGTTLPVLAEVAGYAVVVVLVAELAVVTGAAVAGMLRAGERGHRLASRDVSLLPPQLRGRRRGPPG